LDEEEPAASASPASASGFRFNGDFFGGIFAVVEK
jgi:hypothetical protein